MSMLYCFACKFVGGFQGDDNGGRAIFDDFCEFSGLMERIATYCNVTFQGFRSQQQSSDKHM